MHRPVNAAALQATESEGFASLLIESSPSSKEMGGRGPACRQAWRSLEGDGMLIAKHRVAVSRNTRNRRLTQAAYSGLQCAESIFCGAGVSPADPSAASCRIRRTGGQQRPECSHSCTSHCIRPVSSFQP